MDKIISIMISNAHDALKNAYAPYSHFCVAACILTDKENCYTGVNVENASYGLTVCAESSAITAMVNGGERTIKSLVVLASSNNLCSPCGACRQKIIEFSTPETLIYMCDSKGILQSATISELLPFAFIL